MIAIVLVVGLIATLVAVLLSARASRQDAQQEFDRFQGAVQSQLALVEGLIQAAAADTQSFQTGETPAEDLAQSAEGWKEQMVQLHSALMVVEAPSEGLDAKALVIQGVVVLIDAVDILRFVEDLPEAERTGLIDRFNSVINHGTTVLQMAQREIAKARAELGFGDVTQEQLDAPPPLPQPDAPLPVAPADQIPVPPEGHGGP